MTRPILLDTCALIYISNQDRLGRGAEDELQRAQATSGGLLASPISAWEVGQLVSRGRVTLFLDPKAWFQKVLDSGVMLAPMPYDILVNASFLPDSPLRDPADRILAATARAYSYRLMTRDRPLLEYGSRGHLQAIPC
jgi:PIN domain nuclease of toxin-antitoxin system